MQEKAYGTRCSQAVPHPSTILARRCLTSVIRRERVCSSWYGRRHIVDVLSSIYDEVITTHTDIPQPATENSPHIENVGAEIDE